MSLPNFGRERLDQIIAGKFAPATSSQVVLYKAGAQVKGNQTAAVLNVAPGNNFPSGGGVKLFVMRRTGGAWAKVASSVRSVSSSALLTVTVSSSLTVLDGDYLVNIGADTGGVGAEPVFDGSSATVYPTGDLTGTPVAQSKITPNTQGEYQWHSIDYPLWQLVISGSTALELKATSGIHEAVDASNSSGRSAYLAPDPPRELTSLSGCNGLYFNKPSTLAGATGVNWYRDGHENWSLGEDFATGFMSYFALWCRYASPSAGAFISGDILGISWAGSDTLARDPNKWAFNGAMSTQAAKDSPYVFQFFTSNTLQTSGSGLWTAWFGNQAPDFDSGGVVIQVGGYNRPCLLLNNEYTLTRHAAIQMGRQDGATYRGWHIGSDISNQNVQNFGLYDAENAGYRLYVDAAGKTLHSNRAGLNLPSYLHDVLNSSADVTGALNLSAVRHKNTAGTPAVNLAIYSVWAMPDAGGTEYRGAAIGARMTDATAGAPQSTLELWSSYGPAAIMSLTHSRRVGINGTPPVAFYVGQDAATDAAIGFANSSINPAQPTASEVNMYAKGGVLVFQYNDAGTTRYLTIPLTGTGTAWTHGTGAP